MDQSIIDRLGAELRARADRGLQKYGTTLDAAPLTTREILQHAKEEALDLAAYLQKLIDLDRAITEAPERTKAGAAALCGCGYDSAEDVCEYHANIVRARIIAEAPRAWAVQRKAGPDSWQPIHGNDVYALKIDALSAADGHDFIRLVEVVIVELREGE